MALRTVNLAMVGMLQPTTIRANALTAIPAPAVGGKSALTTMGIRIVGRVMVVMLHPIIIWHNVLFAIIQQPGVVLSLIMMLTFSRFIRVNIVRRGAIIVRRVTLTQMITLFFPV